MSEENELFSSHLENVLEECERIKAMTASKTFKDYKDDYVLRYAVERAFINIGEGLGKAEHISPKETSGISHLRNIIRIKKPACTWI